MRRVLAVVLMLWEPLTLALAASTLLRRITEHGVPAYAVLVLKVFVAGVGIAAGMALWQERPGAIVLARWALTLSLAMTLFSRLTHFWPATLPANKLTTVTAIMNRFCIIPFKNKSISRQPQAQASGN